MRRAKGRRRNCLRPARSGSLWRILLAPLLLLLQSLGTVGVVPVAAQTAIRFEAQQVSLDFPDRITFKAQATSGGSPIVRAELVTFSPTVIGSVSKSRQSVDVSPGDPVDLRYERDFGGTSVVPNMPVTYQWRVWTEEGDQAVSAERTFRFEDTRYEWDVRQSDQVAVWTHDRRGDLGERTFELAQQAVEGQRPLFGVDLRQQIQLIIYNDFGEFAAWHSTVGDFIGGEAYPQYAITTQIVPKLGSQESWLMDVVPHEISHLYFAQAAQNPTVAIPTWLNEGVASYNEFGDPASALGRVRAAAATGHLIPLSSLESGFGSHDESRARLAYDEALSAVTYLVDRYDMPALTDLLHTYRSGLSSEPAFEQALGVDLGGFEAAWATWAGAEPGSYVTATPWPFPTFPPSPTPATMGGKAGPEPTRTAGPTATIRPAATPDANSGQGRPNSMGRAAFVGLILVAGLIVWLVGRRLRPMD